MMMKKKLHVLIVLSLLLIGLLLSSSQPASSPQVQKTTLGATEIVPEQIEAQVTRVIDGDTIEVLLNGKKEKVRLIGIDTPEIVDPRKPVQCFAKEASAKTKAFLLGKTVLLESDSSQANRDVYDRLLRYVFLEDGSDVNLMLLQEGYAHEYTYKDNPYKLQEVFRSAEKEARESGRGLWGRC